MTTTSSKADAADKAAATKAAFEPKVDQLVVDPATGRYGIVTDLGREPNPDHADATGRKCPESPEPVVMWLTTGVPSPFGGELRAAAS